MRQKIRVAALALGALLLVPGASVGGLASAPLLRLPSLDTPPAQPASMTVPLTTDPVVVPLDASPNSRGFATGASTVSGATAPAVPADVLAAYTLAVATAPPSCEITVSVLAAIGQVESGNLAGRTLDAGHRAVPAILGPVLDGISYQAVADTDAGQWDGDRKWDRALGPMQLIPSTWRVVGVDMDGDGLRDPQDIDDAAGAAMVYLCADYRNLGTADGLRAAVLAYNHSESYLTQVLAWKAAYDRTDLTGLGSASMSMFDAWALPAVGSLMPASSSSGDSASTAAPTRTSRPQPGPATTTTTPPAPTPAGGPIPAPGPTTGPSKTATTPQPTTGPASTGGPTSEPPTSEPPTSEPSTSEPSSEPTPTPTPVPADEPSPTCPTPTSSDPMTIPAPEPTPVLTASGEPVVVDPCAPVLTPSADPTN